MRTVRKTTVLFTIIFLGDSLADFEVCNPGVSNTVYQFSYENCPFGVLFEHPISINCLASTNYPESFVTDLCSSTKKPLDINKPPYQIHLTFQMEHEPVDPNDSCFGVTSEKCDVLSISLATNESLTPPIPPSCDPGYYPDLVLTPEEEARRQDPLVFNQTEKLARFMLGLIDDENSDGGPNLRLIKLLKAFLFLFRESELTNFKDIPVAEYYMIDKMLRKCENMQAPFKLIGRRCRTCSHVYSIEKMGKILRYQENEHSFEWGKYDVPTDAAWSIVAFVHGLCHGTFKLNLNYHHLYEREMERLFTPEILYRWSRPPKLYYEGLWDHLFSTSVKDTMRNLDVSIFGAYTNTPFLHRLERPILQNDKEKIGKRRKKRSLLPIMSLDDGGLQGAGWCFQSAEELSGTVNAYIDFHCPDLSPLKGMQIFQKRETDHEKDDAVYASAGSESDEFVHE